MNSLFPGLGIGAHTAYLQDTFMKQPPRSKAARIMRLVMSIGLFQLSGSQVSLREFYFDCRRLRNDGSSYYRAFEAFIEESA